MYSRRFPHQHILQLAVTSTTVNTNENLVENVDYLQTTANKKRGNDPLIRRRDERRQRTKKITKQSVERLKVFIYIKLNSDCLLLMWITKQITNR